MKFCNKTAKILHQILEYKFFICLLQFCQYQVQTVKTEDECYPLNANFVGYQVAGQSQMVRSGGGGDKNYKLDGM